MASLKFRCCLAIAVLLLCPILVKATHIRAGEIIAELVSCQGLTYRFTIIGYEDTGSDVEFGNGIIEFGDGESKEVNTENEFFDRVVVDPQKLIRKSRFVITHTFPGPGEYTITFKEFNRNEGIRNMSNSVNTPFYIETKIVIDPLLACNNSPVLLNPPVEGAVLGKAFIHNPGAYDPDGDSLSYKFVVPKQDRDLPVDSYFYPDTFDIRVGDQAPDATNQAGTGPPVISIDPVTGELVWDAPNSAGEFNVAFIVEEWRQINGEWIKLGYVTRDMQIIVDDADNEPPLLTIPADTCIEAGTLLQAEVTAEDPDNNTIQIEAFGSVFQPQTQSPATFSPNPPVPQPSPATGEFSWQTHCSDVSIKPYQIHFKAADVDVATGPSLADYKIWNVTVVGAAPKGLSAAAAAGRAVNLTWDEYACGEADSIRIQIWRKADSSDFTPGHCEIGIPEGLGYELVATVDQSVVAYRDENLDPGVNYCYRLVAVFADGAESYASEEVCAEMAVDAPVITQVSVTATDTARGSIAVAWTPPLQIDTTLFPPPYSYEVIRISSSDTVFVSGRLTDTSFTDTGLNTANEVYSYQIYLYDAAGTLTDSSAVASSVWLEPTPAVGSIALNWQADVPWSNTSAEHPYHYVYRNKVDESNAEAFVLIDSVQVTAAGLSYVDDGSFNNTALSDEEQYCYYIVTAGSYGHALIAAPLLNNSQIACAQPNDTIPPCQPVAIAIPNANTGDHCQGQLTGVDCQTTEFENRIVWQANTDGSCDDDVRSYNIYFSATGEEDTYTLLANTTEAFFVHGPLTSLAGCYRVAAVDRSGNESERSEPVCNDNCPVYELPNVFTPDGNQANPTFRPFDGKNGPCPRFVKSVHFRVYNRWGKEIYTYQSGNENSIYIDWDGRLETGELVPSGVYYYVADVEFIALDPDRRLKTIKGWVQVLYSDPFIE